MAKRKVIITVAQTGNFQGKAQNPNLPEQPAEVIQSAYECYNAGAAIVHIHAPNKEVTGSVNRLPSFITCGNKATQTMRAMQMGV